MSKKSLILSSLTVFGIFGLASIAFAQTGPYIGLDYGQYTGLGSEDIRFTIALIIRVILGLLGTLALVVVVYAGFKWMTSGGNEETVKGAQKMLVAALIGLAIILSAYSITRFVTAQLLVATHEDVYSPLDVQ